MVLLRRYLLPSVLLIALLATIVLADDTAKDASSDDSTDKIVAAKPIARSSSRMMRRARTPTAQHPAGSHQSAPTSTTVPATPAKAGAQSAEQERNYEQQVIVVKGNPSEEKLNEEIRKAIRALLGPEQGDQVQIRELKNEEELRRVAPGARPVGVRLVP
uniref:Uncharacterized protein n=1 Tax=Anopheles arabiensis TaxID=7173 RepID=A0A453YKB2_ANOAR